LYGGGGYNLISGNFKSRAGARRFVFKQLVFQKPVDRSPKQSAGYSIWPSLRRLRSGGADDAERPAAVSEATKRHCGEVEME
jgi:hypothetical protein